MGSKYHIIAKNGIEGESFFRWIYNAVGIKNENKIIIVIGKVGSGKSWSCLRIGEKVNELFNRGPFNVDHCCRTFKEFIDLINSGTLKKGDVIILDEIGVAMSNRDWQSLSNKLFSYLLQTFRNLNLVVLFNLPDLRMVDTHARRLTHCVLESKGVNYNTETVTLVPKVRQTNLTTGKDYWKFLRVKKGSGIKKVKRITLSKPSKEITEEYEKRKKEFTEELNRTIQARAELLDRKDKAITFKGSPKPLTEFQEKIWGCLKEGMKVQKEIAEKLGKDFREISVNIGYMRRKGYNVDKYLRKSGFQHSSKLKISA